MCLCAVYLPDLRCLSAKHPLHAASGVVNLMVTIVIADSDSECRRTIYDDPFIRNYIEDLLKNIRTQVVLNIVQPYTRIRIPFISKHLNIPENDVEQLLVSLILDNRIRGHIDQVTLLNVYRHARCLPCLRCRSCRIVLPCIVLKHDRTRGY